MCPEKGGKARLCGLGLGKGSGGSQQMATIVSQVYLVGKKQGGPKKVRISPLRSALKRTWKIIEGYDPLKRLQESVINSVNVSER